MYGYATNETENYLPAPISFAHKLSRRLEQVRKEKILPFLLPDGKTQVTIEYDENGKIQRVDTIVISSQHKADVSQEEIHKGIKSQIIEPVLGKYIDEKTIIHINPTGKFTIG
jgi:S-adenosylmethionine synthetase